MRAYQKIYSSEEATILRDLVLHPGPPEELHPLSCVIHQTAFFGFSARAHANFPTASAKHILAESATTHRGIWPLRNIKVGI